jgi:hypothetical protein
VIDKVSDQKGLLASSFRTVLSSVAGGPPDMYRQRGG